MSDLSWQFGKKGRKQLGDRHTEKLLYRLTQLSRFFEEPQFHSGLTYAYLGFHRQDRDGLGYTADLTLLKRSLETNYILRKYSMKTQKRDKTGAMADQSHFKKEGPKTQ